MESRRLNDWSPRQYQPNHNAVKPILVKRIRRLVSILSLVLLVAVLLGGWFYWKLRNSLPLLDGSVQIASLGAETTIERDGAGVPTIRGQTRSDVASALGFLHAQERFFQMDLSRRKAAGELSALIGKGTIELDKKARLHGFRKLAQTIFSRLPAAQKQLLEAYTSGVNQGLAQLKSQPFEYVLLRSTPTAWKSEDSILLIYAMTLDLQDDEGGYEQSLAALRDTLGSAAVAFFAPLIGPDDAALDGSLAPLSPLPSEKVIDLRQRPTASSASWIDPQNDSSVLFGSNGFALAGLRTADGGALLANDMHLRLRLPNVWYRASLIFPHPVSKEALRITGVTLPGAPVVVAGSNGHIAWGFTNANADVSDLVLLDISTIDPSIYARGQELLQIEKRPEVISVRGGEPVEIQAPWTVFGPVVGKNARGRTLALKWTAHDPNAANYNLVDLELATTAEEGIAIAHRSGIPVQNFVVADQTGKIGWTICGFLPKRVGFDGRLPVSWTFGDRRWDGFLSEEEIPTLISPSSGQIWTANQRVLNSDSLLRLGDGGYERPQRAARIRDLLTGLQGAQATDLLKVQLDTGAPHLERWHGLLERVLTEGAIGQKKDRAELKAALRRWEARADLDSVSYFLVKRFRRNVVTEVFTPLFERCVEAYPEFSFRRFHCEPALWDMIEKRPAHLLNPRYATWDDLLLAAADEVLEELQDQHLPIERATWGQDNTARIQHPLAGVNALFAAWLSAPREPLSGDYDTPRVQAPDDGASERFVVSPGREDHGIFHMPGGQSGHPLSPYFLAGHEAWVHGKPTPFLPGKTEHTLTLRPVSVGK